MNERESTHHTRKKGTLDNLEKANRANYFNFSLLNVDFLSKGTKVKKIKRYVTPCIYIYIYISP